MVKGAQKQMVVVKINDSDVFEEAYFVVRRGASAIRMDMISEANKIVESSVARRRMKGAAKYRGVAACALSFFIGSLIGAMIVGVVMMLS